MFPMVKLASLLFFLFSLSFLKGKDPLYLCLLLLSSSLPLGLVIGLNASKWLMWGIILIFSGGMMVIFLYTTSLSTNNKFSPQSPTGGKALVVGLLVLSLTFFSGLNLQNSTYFLIMSPSPPQLYFLLAYLLFALFLVGKLVDNFKGSLKPYY